MEKERNKQLDQTEKTQELEDEKMDIRPIEMIRQVSISLSLTEQHSINMVLLLILKALNVFHIEYHHETLELGKHHS